MKSPASQNKLAALGLTLSDWFERWFPDAFALAMAAVVIVFLACLAIGSPSCRPRSGSVQASGILSRSRCR
jgi:short subunit fatty acids transporter